MGAPQTWHNTLSHPPAAGSRSSRRGAKQGGDAASHSWQERHKSAAKPRRQGSDERRQPCRSCRLPAPRPRAPAPDELAVLLQTPKLLAAWAWQRASLGALWSLAAGGQPHDLQPGSGSAIERGGNQRSAPAAVPAAWRGGRRKHVRNRLRPNHSACGARIPASARAAPAGAPCPPTAAATSAAPTTPAGQAEKGAGAWGHGPAGCSGRPQRCRQRRCCGCPLTHSFMRIVGMPLPARSCLKCTQRQPPRQPGAAPRRLGSGCRLAASVGRQAWG